MNAPANPIDYEAPGQVRKQLDFAGAAAVPRRRRDPFREQLDKLVSFYASAGKPNAVLYVTRAQLAEMRSWVSFPPDPFIYCGHRVAIAPDPIPTAA